MTYIREIHGMEISGGDKVLRGDYVRITWGTYQDLETEVLDLGVTDRIKVKIPVYQSLHNQRNTAWVCARNCVLIEKPTNMKPLNISLYAKEVRDVLVIHNLTHLEHQLGDEKFIKTSLKEYFTKLESEGKPIPEDLDWIYSQYHNITVAYTPLFNQKN